MATKAILVSDWLISKKSSPLLKRKITLINASYQVSVHLDKRFQRRRFLKIGQSETRIACGGHVW
jgi:hypothetical protein